MSSAAWCSSVHQRPRHLKTKKNLFIESACCESVQKQFSRPFFLGLENSLNSRNLKKKKTHPDAKKMEKQVKSSDDADRG